MPDAMPVRGAGRQRSGWDVLPRCRASGRGPAPLYPEPKSMGWIDPSGARAFRALDQQPLESLHPVFVLRQHSRGDRVGDAAESVAFARMVLNTGSRSVGE